MGDRGVLLAVDGGEGAGKSSIATRLAAWVAERGREVVLTCEPGDTELGRALRETLLRLDGPAPTPRAEALLFAADRADHVAVLVRPALQRGAVVVTDRYVDSSLAYQGAGRDLDPAALEALSDWATEGLHADLTVLLDVPPAVGLARLSGPSDRLEAEPTEFHERVRAEFLRLAARHADRYLVVDAARPPEVVWADVAAGVAAWWASAARIPAR